LLYFRFAKKSKHLFLKTDGAGNLSFSSDLPTTSFTGATAETTIAGGDSVLIYDDSAAALRKMTRTNFVSGIGGTNTPAFEATLNTSQSLTSAVTAKVQFAVEVFDTDSCYDNTTNYRFTPTVAGKYFVYVQTNFSTGAGAVVIQEASTQIKKNGTIFNLSGLGAYANNLGNYMSHFNHCVIEFNGTTDYVEVFAEAYLSSGTVTLFQGSPVGTRNFFGAYKIIE